MPARTGGEYLAGLRDQRREVWLDGERVADVTTHPGTRRGAASVASLYDMQHDPKLRDEMTYASPSSGDRVGLSFITPSSIEELERRRRMMATWAGFSGGMLGRSPDYLNVSLMAEAAASEYFARNRPEFAENIRRYYEHVRENDLALTHTLVNMRRSREAAATLGVEEEVGLHVVKEAASGVMVKGARVLATLGPISDEIMVAPSTVLRADKDPDRFAVSFSIPCGARGLRFVCRESFDLGRSTFDHPLGSRFEEMDAIVIFDDVLVPWERVFLLGDVELCNNAFAATNAVVHMMHQVVTKNIAKSEFVVGLASMVVDSLGSGQIPQVQERVAELIMDLEVMRACLRASEADAALDEWGGNVSQQVAVGCGAEPVPADVSSYDRDSAAPGVEQPNGHSHRSRLRLRCRRRPRSLSCDRRRDRPGPGQVVPAGVGRRMQRLRKPPGLIREVLLRRPVADGQRPVRGLRQGAAHGPVCASS